MRVWIIELTEPLPIEPEGRTMRCGHLAQELVARGDEVVWWTSSFSHIAKRFRCAEQKTVVVNDRLRLELLGGPGYSENVPWARVLSHRARAGSFRELAPSRRRPDVIFSALPTLELSQAAVEFGGRHHVPVAIDLRDKWPDAYVSVLPRLARPLARLALQGEFRRMRSICHQARALFGVSRQYLEWGLQYAGREAGQLDGVFFLGYDPELESGERQDASYGSFLAELGIAADEFVVCFVGTFGATYDLATVIRAAARFTGESGSRVRFILAGDGPRAEKWKLLAAGLPNVAFPGWLSAGQIGVLLRRADAGISAYSGSAPQSLPNKAFEYFAGGLPVLSSLQGELKELLETEQVGLTYRAGDAEDLCRQLRFLIESKDARIAMGQRARRLAETTFSAPRITKQIADRLTAIGAAG